MVPLVTSGLAPCLSFTVKFVCVYLDSICFCELTSHVYVLQMELAVAPLCRRVSDLGKAYRLLRSFRWVFIYNLDSVRWLHLPVLDWLHAALDVTHSLSDSFVCISHTNALNFVLSFVLILSLLRLRGRLESSLWKLLLINSERERERKVINGDAHLISWEVSVKLSVWIIL